MALVMSLLLFVRNLSVFPTFGCSSICARQRARADGRSGGPGCAAQSRPHASPGTTNVGNNVGKICRS